MCSYLVFLKQVTEVKVRLGSGERKRETEREINFVCLVGWFFNVLVNYKAISRTGPKTECLTILRAATHETELGDHDFCLRRSHYTDTDPINRERAVTAGIEPRTSSPGVARSTDLATALPERKRKREKEREI